MNEIRRIAANGPAIGTQTGYTLDEMHSKEMQSILDVLNQYTETWVYPDEDDRITDQFKIAELMHAFMH